MKNDLGAYKLKSEAEDSLHIEHPSGKKFTFEKGKMSPKALALVKKMCSGGQAMADGGVVDTDLSDMEESAGEPQIAQPQSNYAQTHIPIAQQLMNQFAQNTANTPPNPYVPQMQSPQEAPQTSSQAPQTSSPPNLQTVPQSTNTPNPFAENADAQTKILQEQMKNQQQYLQSIGASGGQASQASADLLKQMQAMKTPEQLFQDNQAKDAELLQNVMSKRIDPDRYIHSMSTGSKIAASIAMIIGGIGGGSTGRNSGVDALNQSINNDIEAQKNDQTNANNLYQMNHQALKDHTQATLTTQNQMLTIAQAKIAAAAANSQNAANRLNAQQGLSQIQQQINQNNMTKSLFQHAQQNNGAPGGMGVDPGMVVNRFIQDPAQKAAAMKEIESAQKAEEVRSIYNQNFKNLEGSVLGGKFSPENRKQAVTALAAKLNQNLGIRQDQAKETAEGMLPGGGWSGMESEETLNNKFRNGHSLIDSMRPSGSTMASVGLPLSMFSSTATPAQRLNPTQQRIYNAAIANPQDPASAVALKKLGVR